MTFPMNKLTNQNKKVLERSHVLIFGRDYVDIVAEAPSSQFRRQNLKQDLKHLLLPAYFTSL